MGYPYSKNPKASADRARRTTSSAAYTRLVNELIFWAALRRNPKKNQTRNDNFTDLFSQVNLVSFAALWSSAFASKEKIYGLKSRFPDRTYVKQQRFCGHVQLIRSTQSSSKSSQRNTYFLAMTHPTSSVIGFLFRDMCICLFQYFIIIIYWSRNRQNVLEQVLYRLLIICPYVLHAILLINYLCTVAISK